ncbi:group II intron maturase-specific domain-containing protein [Paraburkholderia mimosarum]|uniref:group II intron maturase-specific domain-containing protein n=1 Tax=Paraburkholderia mimosarum TaxID=312026 RepID=UPI003CC67988
MDRPSPRLKIRSARWLKIQSARTVLRGWLSYYGKFSPSAMYPVLRHFNRTLIAWGLWCK